MSELLYEIQSELKENAKTIKEARSKKDRAFPLSHRTRHLHILYGVLRGVPLESMEKKCHSPLEEYAFKAIEKKYNTGVDYDEIIRYSRSVLV